jgi:hypothetical protein
MPEPKRSSTIREVGVQPRSWEYLTAAVSVS